MNPEYVAGLIVLVGTLATVIGSAYTARSARLANASTSFATLVNDQVKDILLERDKQADSDSKKIVSLTDRIATLDAQMLAMQDVRNNERLERQATERLLELAQAEIRDLRRVGQLDQMPEALVAIDALGDIQFINQAAIAMFGFTSAQVLGGPLGRLMPERLRRPHRTALHAAVDTGTFAKGDTLDTVGLTATGVEIAISVIITRVRGLAGSNGLFIGVIRLRVEAPTGAAAS